MRSIHMPTVKRSLAVGAIVIAAGACSAGSSPEPGDARSAVTTSIAPGRADPGDGETASPSDTTSDTTDDATSDTTDGGSVPSSSTEPTSTESTTAMSQQPPTTAQPLYEPGDIDEGLRPFIDQAIDDLARRLGVDADTIGVRAAVLVVWPDSSLGCPRPGMSYAQANVDGSVIELEHDGDVYRYHTGGLEGPFLCEQPLDKRPPTELLPLDTSPTESGTGNDD